MKNFSRQYTQRIKAVFETSRNLSYNNIYINIYTYMTFTTEGFFEVAIESWPEWDLNPQPLNSVQTLSPIELSGHEFNSHSEPTLCSYFNFILCSVSDFISAIALVSRRVYVYRNFLEVITWVWPNELIHVVFTIEGFFEVAIESWPEWAY